MARIDPAKKAAKWAAKVANAGQDWVEGTQSVQDSPMAAAVQHQDALLSRFTRAVQNGSWAAATGSVSLQSWKDSTRKAQGTFVQGAQKGQPKIQKYLTAAAPRYEAIRAEIKAMPNSTDADRQARMLRNLELMRSMKGVGRGG